MDDARAPGQASGPVAAAQRLRRVVAQLQNLGNAEAAEVAAGLRAYLDGDTADLAATLGLGPGWRAEVARAARDCLICELAGGLDGTVHSRASEVATLLARYGATAWRFDRQADAMPSCYAGTRHELLYRIHRLDPDPPTSIRQLQSIVGNGEALAISDGGADAACKIKIEETSS